MAEVKVFTKDGKESKTIELNAEVFEQKINRRLLELVSKLYANNKRTGNAHTKTRAEVRGGSKKPWKQKGTGRARVSSIRSPLWRGGGTVFGPRKRDIYNVIPKKVKEKALKVALTKKLREESIIVVDDLAVSSTKTKECSKVLSALKIDKKNVLWLAAGENDQLKLATRNIKKVSLKTVTNINAYDVLKKSVVLVDVASIKALEERVLKSADSATVAA